MTWLSAGSSDRSGINLSYLLLLYATSTGIYALCVVMIAYEMSAQDREYGMVQLVVSGFVIAGIYAFHQSLAQSSGYRL